MAIHEDPIWNAMPYPAFTIDAQDRILSCNPAAENVFSTSLRQMQRKPIAAFLGTDSPVMEAIAQTRSGSATVVQYGIDLSWGEKPARLFTIHAATIPERAGETLLLFHPMGLAAQMDRSLSHRSAARSVTGMAAMLAHEIRNPLAGISGAAQLLSMSLSDDEQELTDLIQKETARIGQLVERVEQFGELRPTARKPVNIHDVVDRAKRAAEAGYARQVRFIETYDPSLPPTLGDPDQLMQVFQNLLKNAAEACPQVGGVIRIRSGYQPGVKLSLAGKKAESLPLTVSIIDNGGGIPEGLIRDIFEPFVSSKANGTGLGLSLVSKVMADHGGVVEVDSQPGRTEFRVRLPMVSAAAEEEEVG
ncbi:MAG: ATP-binding protein [Pseudomonadota bacterium]